MNSSSSTLSGVKDANLMAKRYDSVIKLYEDIEKNHPEISNLMKFWKKHRLYNRILLLAPIFIRKKIYILVDKIKNIKTRKALKIYASENKNEYYSIKEYRKLFN